MARVKRGFKARRRRNRVLRQARGFFGSRSRLYKVACVAVMHSLSDAFIGRKLKKRDLRRLWITRIGAAARLFGLSYSGFMGGLKRADVALNRKILADLAVTDPEGFSVVANIAKGR